MSYPVPKAWLELALHLLQTIWQGELPPTGCDFIQVQADLLTLRGKDRRVLNATMKELTRGIARKAAQAAAKAAEDGEI